MTAGVERMEQDDKGGHDHGSLNMDVMVFPFMCLFLGIVIDLVRARFFARRSWSLPSTVFLLIVSSLVSCLLHQFLDEDDPIMVHVNTVTWIGKHPHEIMTVLLPVLVFESSFRLHAHDFYHHLGMILSLAILGFVLSAIVLSALMFTMMAVVGDMRGWGFLACFTYGAIISATDPVAVVALLDELGAPAILHILIDGEALVNDGAAIIAFKVFEAGLQSGPEDTAWLEKVPELLAGVLLSVLIGYLIAQLILWILVHLLEDVTKEQAILVLSVFAVFIVCEKIPLTGLEGSGVLGLVIFGVTLSGRKEHLQPRTVEECLHLWEFLAYWANSVVFILTGLWIGKYLMMKSQGMEEGLVLWWMGGVLAYVFSLIARFVVIAVIFGVRRLTQLESKQPHFSWQYIFMISWGGLRGAVALLLAIQLKMDHIEETVQDYTLIYVGFTVLLSLILQGGTYEPLAKLTKLNERSLFVKNRMKQRLFQLKHHTARKLFLNLQMSHKHYYLSEADWPWIWNTIAKSLRHKKKDKERDPPSQQNQRGRVRSEKHYEPMPPPFERPRVSEAEQSETESPKGKATPRSETMDSYLHLLKARLTNMWEERLFTSRTVRSLSNTIDVAIDKGDLPSIGQMAKDHPFRPGLQALVKLARLVPRSRRLYPPTHDWWRIGTFLLSTFCSVLICGAVFSGEYRHGVILALFFISIYSVVEQTALLPRSMQNIRSSGGGPVGLLLDFFLCLDVVYIFIDLGIVIVSGHALNEEQCIVSMSGGTSVFKNHVPYCRAMLYFLLGASGFRSVLKLPFALFLLTQLLAQQLCRYYTVSVHMSRVANLLSLIRITEEVGCELLAKVIPGQDHLIEACRHNRVLRKRAEGALAELLHRNDHLLPISRLIQTRQAARLLINDISAEVRHMEKEGMLSQEESKELEVCAAKALWKVSRLADSGQVASPRLLHMIPRIHWFKYGKKKQKQKLYEFLTSEGVLVVKEGTSSDGKYAKDHVFYKEGEKTEGLYFIVSGLVEFVRLNPLPYGEIRQYIYPGGFFGERSALEEELNIAEEKKERLGTVTAVTRSEVYFMAQEQVKRLTTRFPYIGNVMGLELSITMVQEIASQYQPYSSMKPDEVKQRLEQGLATFKVEYKKTVEAGLTDFVLTGVLKRDDEDEVLIVQRGQKPSRVDPGTTYTLAPVTVGEPAYIITVKELREEQLSNVANKSIFVN